MPQAQAHESPGSHDFRFLLRVGVREARPRIWLWSSGLQPLVSRRAWRQGLQGEEEGADWLESQLHLVEEVGKEQYLAEQIHD